MATAAEVKAVRWLHSHCNSWPSNISQYPFPLHLHLLSFIFRFLFIFESVSPISPIYLTDFPFSLSVLPPTYPSSLTFLHPSLSQFLIVHPSLFPVLLIIFLSFLLCLGSICAALGKICWERKRGRIERRKTWKMDSVWALHYNGELSQGRFALPLNDASICIYSPSCTSAQALVLLFLSLLGM